MPSFPIARDIDEAVVHLDDIIADCRGRECRMGYFAALYRRVTVEVKGRMQKGQFHDSERMEALDTTFANRYLEAYHQHRRGQTPTRAWAYAFAAADDPEPVMLQHLLLGMNAHISLDLGIAASAITRRFPGDGFRDDFDAINYVLTDMVDEIQDEVSQSSGILQFLDDLGGRLDEKLFGYGLAHARGIAWRRAEALMEAPEEAHAALIDEYDRAVERTARRIHRPVPLTAHFLTCLRSAEQASIPDLIDRLT
jgi:hypothetical protein